METFPLMKTQHTLLSDREDLQRLELSSRSINVDTHHPSLPLRQRPLPASFWQEPNRHVLPRPEEIFPMCFDPILQRSFMDQMLAYKLYVDSMQIRPLSSPYPFTDILYGLKHRTTVPPNKTPSPFSDIRPQLSPPYFSRGPLELPKASDKSGSVLKPIATKSQSLSRSGHRYHPFLPPK